MKAKFKYLTAIALLAFCFAGCTDSDTDVNPVAPEVEEETSVQLKLKDIKPNTYNSSETEDASESESKISENLKIYIFNALSGVLEKNEVLKFTPNPSVEGEYLSDKFTMKSGKKYIYVFSNSPAVSVPASRTILEKNVIDAGFNANDLPAALATGDAFLIGTLWGDMTSVGINTPGNVVTLPLNIGRAVSKVCLKTVSKGTSNLLGTFTNPNFRLCSVPVEAYLVGQWTTVKPPAVGSKIISAVHDQISTGSGPGGQNPKFRNYDWNNKVAVGGSFYAVENTTREDILHYGNTTYIQIEIVYTPDPTELHGKDGTQGGTLDPSGDFWTGELNGQVLIFWEEPEYPVTTVRKYTTGLNYYSVPIRDDSESGLEQQYAILRNHYYELAVTAIKKLGSNNGGIIEPPTPIEVDTDVKFQVTVVPWYKIGQEIEL